MGLFQGRDTDNWSSDHGSPRDTYACLPILCLLILSLQHGHIPSETGDSPKETVNWSCDHDFPRESYACLYILTQSQQRLQLYLKLQPKQIIFWQDHLILDLMVLMKT